jgi:NAD(P)-dependent dehydrogenase (short-subunit alcohol dehydrogenase family)
MLVKADISRRVQVERMFKSTYLEFGRIDLLVNNSAVFVECEAGHIPEKTWNDTIDINLTGTFLCIQSALPYLLKEKYATIINIASLGGIQAWQKHIPYSVSKAGVIMLTKCFAKALAPNIRVNAIAPGTIIMKGEEDPSLGHVSSKSVPLKRYGKPSDITDAVLFLATNATYTTGQILSVDGGRSIQ